MINTIVGYVNYYMPRYKSNIYCDGFIRCRLVYKYLDEKYFSHNTKWALILYRLFAERNSFVTNSNILRNHLIFSAPPFAHSGNIVAWGEDVFMSLTHVFKGMKRLVI